MNILFPAFFLTLGGKSQLIHVATEDLVIGNSGDTVEIPCSFYVDDPGEILPTVI